MSVANSPASRTGGSAPVDRVRRFRAIVLVFGCLMLALVAALAVQAFRSVTNDRQAILDNALGQGYWIARSLELGHSGMQEEQTEAMRDMLREIVRHEEIVSLELVKADRTVLMASDRSLEGNRWPGDLATPEELGRVVRSDLRTTVLAYAAHFSEMSARMGNAHPNRDRSVDRIKWVVVTLSTKEAYAHYRSGVTQSILMVVLTAGLAVAAVIVLGVFQRNLRLEQIKLGLQRFVPGTVRKLIEKDPAHHGFEKVERNASVVFLDIEGYTRLSEDTPPEVLNRLVEKYFSAFLDTILSHGGEINETAGDGIMAIFTGKTPSAHAHSAVAAGMAIRAQTRALNIDRAPGDPEMLVNIGINSGDVLIGATTIKGATGEHLTYTASGTVTNAAARLCDLGAKGEICIAAATAELVRDSVALVGPQLTFFKNVRLAVPVYRVT